MTVPISHGTTIVLGSLTIGRVINLGELSQMADEEDITTYESTNAYKEKLLTLLDAGELPCAIEYDGTATTGEAALLQAKFVAKTYETLTITINDGLVTGSKFACSAAIKKLGTQWSAAGGKIIQNITFSLSGAVTHTPKVDA